jgi:hypothetical protein
MITANITQASPLESYMTIDEWREQGRDEERRKLQTGILNLKRVKTPDDVIAQAFSLPIEQVRAIHA